MNTHTKFREARPKTYQALLGRLLAQENLPFIERIFFTETYVKIVVPVEKGSEFQTLKKIIAAFRRCTDFVSLLDSDCRFFWVGLVGGLHGVFVDVRSGAESLCDYSQNRLEVVIDG